MPTLKAQPVALTSEFPQANGALQGRYRLRNKQTLGRHIACIYDGATND
jgi:hypothetical protein